jgi:hypothetical protein
MLKLKHPLQHGYVGAELDEEGNPIKVVCDAFEVMAFGLDGATSPMGAVVVTYRRINSETLETGGPVTQHIITGTDLTDMLEASSGALTIDAVEDSTLLTGIPGVHMTPEDFDGKIPSDTMGRFISNTKKEAAKLKAQSMKPVTVPPVPTGPPTEPPQPVRPPPGQGPPPGGPPGGPPPEVTHHEAKKK